VFRAGHEGHARSTRRRADRDLSRLHRGLRGHARRRASEDRLLRRGDPAGPPGEDVDEPGAAVGGDGAPGAHAAARSRREARLDDAGDLVLLEDQDRDRWNHPQIGEALPLVEEALRGGPGPFAVQAAIAALHCQATRAEDTDWAQIVGLYDLLESLQP